MKTMIAKRAKAAFGGAVAFAGLLARNLRSKMIIVTFHRVNDDLPEDGLTVSSAKFTAFCEFFSNHLQVVPLTEQVAGCSEGREMGGTLSVTFDDGYRDNAEVAAPILRRLGLPATFFVVTGFIGTQTIVPCDRNLPRQPGWMDWDQLRSLTSQGFEIGSHTDSHIDLGTADAQTVRKELETSKRRLHEQLGKPPRLFAYPYGGRENITDQSRQIVREAGFDCCVSCFGGVNGPSASPFGFNRVTIGEGFRTPAQFGFDVLIGRV
jgi:peptidoglycan/xylan/chitin deacetylase (PgdA/CDA1 family)